MKAPSATPHQARLKILYHHRTASRDGQAVHIEELTRALADRGHQIILVGPEATAREDFGGEARAFALVRKALPGAFSEALELAYARLAYRRLRAAFRRHRPDVLYERYNLFLPSGVWLKERHGLPMLLEVNSPLFEERERFGGLRLKRLARWSERRTWLGADYVLPVSHELAAKVREAGVPEERIEVIPNGVDRRRFADTPPPEEAKRRLGVPDRLVLGFTGFVREWHRLERVLDWMAGGAGAPATTHLLVVGDGPARPALEEHAARLGLASRLTFTGVVGRDDVAAHIAAFDLALQPAVTPYASPLKLFEYMAVGRAIVAPASANIREVLVDGETALLFDEERPEALAEALARGCASVEVRRRLGEAARRAIVDRGLTWEANAVRVEALMRSLTATRRGRASHTSRAPATHGRQSSSGSGPRDRG